MPKTINQYDSSYKKLFTNQEVVASLLQGFVPASIRADMDLSTLEPLPSEHITRNNKERRNDLLWKVKYGAGWCYLIIMLEFQSAEDWWMALRVSQYSALLLEDIIKYGKLNRKDRLPLIFPFVIYNGDKKWHAPQEINQLFFEHDKNIDIYQPHQKYYLLDIRHLPGLDKDSDDNLSVQIFNFENSPSLEGVISVLANLVKLLPEHEKSHIHEAFINLLSINIIDDPELSRQLVHCKTVQEAYTMLVEGAPRWKKNLLEEGFVKGKMAGKEEGIVIGKEEGFVIGKEEGFVKGKEEGFVKGKEAGIKNAIQEILASRFGLLSRELMTSIDEITNINTLKSLVLEATVTESLSKFSEKIQNRHD